MPANKNDVSTIGNQIGRLIQQYDLRITYAKFRAELMEEERLKASTIGEGRKTFESTVSRQAWSIYAKNLATKKNELALEVKKALIGYNTVEREAWWRYFIERKSAEQVATEIGFSLRSVQRLIASMKADMELRFSQILPRFGDKESPKWSHTELARFLSKKEPSDEYARAVKDMIEYGIVSIDLLEFDPEFQDFLKGVRG